MAMFVGCIVFIIGVAIQTGANGFAMMIVGRVVGGLGIGTLSMVVPLFISEIAPKEIRGRLISLQQLMITVGLMIAFWVSVGTEKYTNSASWRIPTGIQLGPGLILVTGSLFLPESPRWLVKKGRKEEALRTLAKLHADGDETNPYVVEEHNDICQQVELEQRVSVTSYTELFKKEVRRRLFLGVLVQVFQQFTGINSILYYAPKIFQQAGVEGKTASLIASGVNGVLNMIATLPAILFLDKLGRRGTLMTGAIVMGAAMILCGAVMGGTASIEIDPASGEKVVDMSGNVSASYFCIVMIYIFVAGFAASWGPVGWVYPAEIYPLNIRAKATSITTSANWLMNFVISQIVPSMLAGITWGTYIFFGCCCVVMTICVFLFYPETKGRSLEEMDYVFSGSAWAFKNKGGVAKPHQDVSLEKAEYEEK